MGYLCPPRDEGFKMFGLLRLFKPIIPNRSKDGFAGPLPKVNLGTVKSWAYIAKDNGAKHLAIVFIHNLTDDANGIYSWAAHDETQLQGKLDAIDRGCDATRLDVIDLMKDIDAQLVGASYIAQTR